MPPRKASTSASTGPSGGRITRSASGTSSRKVSAPQPTRRPAAKRSTKGQIVESDDDDENSVEGNGSNASLSKRGSSSSSSDDEASPKTAGLPSKRTARQSTDKPKATSQTRSNRRQLSTSATKLKNASASNDNDETARSDSTELVAGSDRGARSGSQARQLIEEDEARSSEDESDAAQLQQRLSKPRQSDPDLKASAESDSHLSPEKDGEQTPTQEDPDKSDSFDADATFVAPSKSARPSADSAFATPAPKHARFSLLSPGIAQTPSTPGNKLSSQAISTGISTPVAPTKPATRLVIHKLVLKDFKSYAGLQTIGPFHKSFSSVVGPNGSGKSNVIDALLFVFGWRANKMRQGKLSELIHSSSIAGKAKPNETQVSVVFREIEDLPGPDAYRVVPNSKLVVSRTAFQNNTSTYHLNSKRSTFTEVTTLLRGRGIDLDHKRFLILQGEVESIAQMPPKARTEHEEGLLEYLEDIIGTSRFKEEIDAAAKTVDERNEERGERLSRLKIVQREKDALEGKKREAESLLRDQNALTHQQSRLWQIYRWESETAIQEASTNISTLKERLASEKEKHKDAQATIAKLECSHAGLQKDWEFLRKAVDQLTKELEKSEKEDLQLEEKRKHFESKKKKLSKTLSEERHQLSETRETLASSEEEIERLQEQISKHESSLESEEAALDEIRDSLKSKTGHLSEQIDAKQRELAPWIEKVKEREGKRDVTAQEMKIIREKEESRANELQTAREQRSQLKEELRGKHQEIQDLRQEKEEVGASIAQSANNLKQARAEEAQLRSKLSGARSKAEDAKSSQQATASQSSVLTSLARQAELGMIKGFHGRLGSLGVIDDKYDVAISTACPGLDSIVVETVECGQACIEHLRKNNLGRANFILMDSISNLRVETVQTPDNVPRLVDLVRPRDTRFLQAFYHQLRDTLVARDLPHANRIAYGAKRWRVVTLDGQLIDKSGTMSGGGTRVAKGGMSSKFADAEYTPEQISRLQQEVVRLDGDLQALSLKINRMEVEQRDLSVRPGQIDVEIEKAQMAMKVGKSRYEEANKRVEELKAQTEPDAADTQRLEQLEGEMQEIQSEITNLRKQTGVYESDIAALQEKILDAGGVRLQAQQSKVQGIREMIELATERLTKSEVAKAKADKDIVKLENSLSKKDAALKELDGELEGLQSSAADRTHIVAQARSLLTEKQHDLEVKQDERDSVKESLDESSNTINAFRSLEVEVKQKLDDSERSHSENVKRVKHWAEKLAGLALHYIDGDEDDEDDETVEASTSNAEAPGEDTSRADQSQQADASTQVHDEAPATNEDRSNRKERPASELVSFSPEELSEMQKDEIKQAIAEIEERVQKGSGNFAVLDEYRRREQEFLARARDLEKTTQERDAAKNQYDVLRKQRLDEFMTGFGIISSKLKEMYQTITLGGNAELELVDSLDPFSEGILFSVMPPKKSWKNISNLSGGEKTLSSLALVFALHAFKPTPLYVMDEIDAALDFRNVSIVANLIKERTKNAQFVIISLRNNMFELASRLVGIYKTNGQTKSLAVENTELSQAVAEEAASASAALAASAKKARTNPNPPKTPSSTVAHAQRLQASMSRYSQLSGMRNSAGEQSLPTTPSSNVLRRTQMTASASLSSFPKSSSMASLASHDLPKTPFAIPQTPRMPKSILARTPRVPSATPRIPSNSSQRSSSAASAAM